MEDNNTSSSAGGTSIKHEDPSVTLTIRLIMQGKEVGSIIGKKGEIVNRFREESGAKINISDGSCPERIVTVSGTTNAIFSAFTLITKKFEEFNDAGKIGKTQIPIRLIVPASQCGSLIGKSGSKIKEIRQTTGCSIQVASEMLPNSTERAVTLSGSAEQITQCIYQICLVMLESPPRGATIPYRPKPQVTGPVILANGQAFTIQGNYAVPTQEVAKNPLASLAALGLAGMNPASTGGINHTGELSASSIRGQADFQSNLGSAPAALAALAGSQLRTANAANRAQQQQHEMTVSNDLIGCIIGKGGTKIAEIRQISGAMIRISNCEEREGGNTDRTITISGNPDSVALAQYLINMSVELQKANLLEQAQAQQNGGAAAVGAGAVPGGAGATVGGGTPAAGTNGALTTVALAAGGAAAAAAVAAAAAAGAGAGSNGSPTGAANGSSSSISSNGSVSASYAGVNGNQSSAGTPNGTAAGINPVAAAAALNSPLASALQLLTKPGALSALSNLSALDLLSLTSLGNDNGGSPGGPPVQTTGVNRGKGHYARFRQHQAETGVESEKQRNKFNPY
ncbi:poly(rC)-binding protein 3 isoform X2 [Drosophila persimilis]|uniref:Poly(RC)-binding protein 3 isoform X8 n=1 Tax=Drosophila pseudoobscura pseudoobscura TaxID=46245 RepID=A0A6I8W9U2_DROPS|nr:poly(rC)-binding protein 3 isoform X2 [Drosophila persimilis]XP_033240160.1 poly(rC)-binding protein 3 isoform X8 [Drosophila pseudoobscura]